MTMGLGVGEFGFGVEAFGDDLIGSLAIKHALTPGIVGGVEAAQELFERKRASMALRRNCSTHPASRNALI